MSVISFLCRRRQKVVQESMLLSQSVRYRRELPRLLAQQEALSPTRITDGTLDADELALLEELVRDASSYSGPIVEIGTLFGFTTSAIAVQASPGKTILTVDNYSWNPWALEREAHFELTRRILDPFIRSGQVRQIRADKSEFYDVYSGGPPSLIFLDAVHTYEETQLDLAWAISAGAGIICGHDYSNDFPGVRHAVDEMGGLGRLRGSLWTLGSTSCAGQTSEESSGAQ